jgi:Phospholipase B
MFPSSEARFASVLLWAAAAFAAQPVLNSSFENPGAWTAVHGKAAPDRQVMREGKSSLRVESDGAADIAVESAPVKLTIGKRYELSGWIRTEGLDVRERDRTPVALGAALTMGSMPFDVHSESVGGTRDWAHVRLRFAATRADDRVLLTAGSGGFARGRAWFNGVSLEEISGTSDGPSAASVETYGPAYRYPVGGWTYLHIQGEPYERGYQHGRLMAHEIPDYVNRCAMVLDSKAKERAWDEARTTVDALFLRGFDREILEEMKGIADGAKDAGAKWGDRPIDLLDIVSANAFTDLETLHGAMPVTPTGLEGLKLQLPPYAAKPVAEHCSAFAATGKATRDGKMVIGHITMWGLLMAEASNVMIDVKPATGHRILIQSYAGGIASGLDWYQNDAGVVLTETTIRQSPFDVRGTPVAYRSRKAIQYGENVDKVVEYLKQDNNGLYTNEWLIGDAKTNEVAMLELGTYKTKLWRSSRDEWFGGTEGFYWGCNNAKDLEVRMEYRPDPKGQPEHVPFEPAGRDIKWQEMYRKYRGRIDEQFGFLAFRTAPLVSSSSMDGKVATSDMASRMMVWAVFGKPNEREWAPGSSGRESGETGIYSGGYRMIEAPAAAPAGKPQAAVAPPKSEPKKSRYKDRLWEGWILPASDADTWLSAGSAEYYNVLRADDWEKELAAERADYSVERLREDPPLRSIVAQPASANWYPVALHKGALVFDALRRELGDEKFLALMKEFFTANTTKPVSSDAFIAAAEKAGGKSLTGFFRSWLDGPGEPGSDARPVYMADVLPERLSSTLIVYGTVLEAGSNRFAAEQLRKKFLDRFESEVPLRKDFEVTDDELKTHDVVFVGRPETNSALAAWKDRLALQYDGAEFRAKAGTHGGGAEALVMAAANPLDPKHVVIVIAGNSALETVRVSAAMPFDRSEYAVWLEGRRGESGFLQ